MGKQSPDIDTVFEVGVMSEFSVSISVEGTDMTSGLHIAVPIAGLSTVIV